MTRLRAVVLGVVLLLPGCDRLGLGSDDPTEALEETAAKLDEIESAHLYLSLGATSEGEAAEGTRVAFEIEGDLQLPEPGALPIADIRYTKILAGEEGTVSFISTGESAFVGVEDAYYELPPEQLAAFRGGEETEAENLFEEIGVDDWIEGPELGEAATTADGETDRISGRLNVAAALNDLVDLAGRFGDSSIPPLEGDAALQARNAVRSSRIEIYTGSDDRFLRRVLIELKLGLDEQVPTLARLAELFGARIVFDMQLSNINEEIDVEQPTDVLPYMDLVPAA